MVHGFKTGGRKKGSLNKVTSEMKAASTQRPPGSPLMTRVALASIGAEVNKLSDPPSKLVSFLSSLKSWFDDQAATFTTAVPYDDIEHVANDIERLDKIQPPPIPSLFGQTELAKSVDPGEATLLSGATELGHHHRHQTHR